MGLDTLEVILGWEISFNISITDSEAETMRTPQAAIDFIAGKVALREDSHQPCLTLRSFNRLRHSIIHAAAVPRDRIRPDARLKDLVCSDRWRTWQAVRVASGISRLPGLGWFSPRTVGDLANWTVANAARELKGANEPWTRSEIRCVIRTVITEATGVTDFKDHDDFIRNIFKS